MMPSINVSSEAEGHRQVICVSRTILWFVDSWRAISSTSNEKDRILASGSHQAKNSMRLLPGGCRCSKLSNIRVVCIKYRRLRFAIARFSKKKKKLQSIAKRLKWRMSANEGRSVLLVYRRGGKYSGIAIDKRCRQAFGWHPEHVVLGLDFVQRFCVMSALITLAILSSKCIHVCMQFALIVSKIHGQKSTGGLQM